MEHRTEQFHFFTTLEAAKLIREKEKVVGILSESTYLRKMAIDCYLIQLDLNDVKEVVGLLGITSANMNQYAKKANETGSIYKKDIADIKAHRDEIWKVMKNILQRLSDI